jgi:peptidoglycan/xylan/chitin deacetylase (PgdA/CDA1 family)
MDMRVVRQSLLRLAQWCGLFAVARRLTRSQLRILCYHGIWLGPQPHYGDCLFMSAGRFRQRMAMLARKGYRVIPLGQACRDLREGRVGARDVVITIDDAWAGTGEYMLPELRAHGYAATLYVTTESVLSQQPVLHVMLAYMVERTRRPEVLSALVGEPGSGGLPQAQIVARLGRRVSAPPDAAAQEAELVRLGEALGVDATALLASRAFHLMTPAALRRAHDEGVDIQLHTHSHRMPDFDLVRMRGELVHNREALEGIVGADLPLVHFCYPGGANHPSLFPLLRELGIQSATTTEPGLNPPEANPLLLRRILDCESLSDLDLEARLSGFWTLLAGLRAAVRGAIGRRPLVSRAA